MIAETACFASSRRLIVPFSIAQVTMTPRIAYDSASANVYGSVRFRICPAFCAERMTAVNIFL